MTFFRNPLFFFLFSGFALENIISCVRKHGIMVWTPFADDHEIKDYIQCLFPCVLLLRLVFEVPLFQSFQNWTMLFPSFSLSLSLFFLAFHMIWNLDSSVDTPLGNIFYLTDLGSKKFSNPISSILLVVYKAKYRESIFWKAVVWSSRLSNCGFINLYAIWFSLSVNVF